MAKPDDQNNVANHRYQLQEHPPTSAIRVVKAPDTYCQWGDCNCDTENNCERPQ